MINKIIITIVVIGVLASLGLNGYFLIWPRIVQRIYLTGVNNVVNTIVQQVKNTGEVRIQTDQENIILVPKINEIQE